jgi:hypothetical protein
MLGPLVNRISGASVQRKSCAEDLCQSWHGSALIDIPSQAVFWDRPVAKQPAVRIRGAVDLTAL